MSNKYEKYFMMAKEQSTGIDDETLEVFPVIHCQTGKNAGGIRVFMNDKEVKTVQSCDISLKHGCVSEVILKFNAIVV